MDREKFEKIPSESSLLDEGMKAQIEGVLSRLTKHVEIKAVVDMEQEKSREMAAFLKTFCTISNQLSLTLLEPGEDKQAEEEMECNALFPVTGFYLEDTGFNGVSFRGIPGGKEINSFVIGLYNTGGNGQPLDDGVRRRIEALSGRHTMQIFVSLACHYCAETVILSQHIAALNSGLHVQMTDAGLYPELVKKYDLERVPVMILDDEKRLMGGKSMEELLAFLESA